MKKLVYIYNKSLAGAAIFLLPMMLSCSVLGGGTNYSSDPTIAAQQREIEDLEREVEDAEGFRKEAEQREKAAKNRLKAAEHELKAMKQQAKLRGY